MPKTIIPPEIEAEMTPAVKAFVLAMFEQFEKRIEELEQQVDVLSRQVAILSGKDPKATPINSSLPGSLVHPHDDKNKIKNRRIKTGKRRGGQKGHKKHSRELVPVDQCKEVIVCQPQACRRCGGTVKQTDVQPRRHQVWEIPPIVPVIVEYQLFTGRCACCGITTQAELPQGVPRGQCGPRLAAFTGLLMGHFRQSRRRAAAFISDLLNVPCSAAWTVKIQNRVSEALEQPYNDLKSQLSAQRQLFVDESPTKQGNDKAWTWVAVASTFTVFGIFLSRGRESLKALVGNYSGIIINCDRAKMYLDGKTLQWCWAHLKRDIQKLIDYRNNQVKRLGHDLMRQEKRLFHLWWRYKSGELKWRTFRRHVLPIKKEFNSLLIRGKFSGNPKLVGFCEELLSHRDWLWTFTNIQGIEPTNNEAERSLRPAVIHRKLTFGTQSDAGSRFLERIMTVTETCRRQKRSSFDYLVDAISAHFHKNEAPSLVPTNPNAQAA
jgi:transposase